MLDDVLGNIEFDRSILIAAIIWLPILIGTPLADQTFYKESNVEQNVELENCYQKRESFADNSRQFIPKIGSCTVNKQEYGFPFKTKTVYQIPARTEGTNNSNPLARAYTAQTGP